MTIAHRTLRTGILVLAACALAGSWIACRKTPDPPPAPTKTAEQQREEDRDYFAIKYKTAALPDDPVAAERLLNALGRDQWVLVGFVRGSRPYAVFRQRDDLTRVLEDVRLEGVELDREAAIAEFQTRDDGR